MNKPDGGLRQEEEMSQLSQLNRNNNCKEMSPSDGGRERGKEGNYSTTVERERMESPRSMKQHGRGSTGEIAGTKGKSVGIRHGDV
jgi:hypothetical protein